jgi:aryl-alcohol dehydrogenase-like predicted oxidoreductase
MMIRTENKLALGTVQLGQSYGIANQIGQPNIEKAIEILSYATAHDISLLDTAPGYGQSEEVIGRFLRQNSTDSLQIITKIPSILDEMINIEKVEDSIEQSKKSLGLDKLYGVLFHDASVLERLSQVDLEWMRELKAKHNINKIGVSIYTPEHVMQVLELGIFDIIQVPMNIFDLRLIKTGLLKELNKANIEIHVRSIYLQGLIFLDEKSIPPSLKEALPYIVKLKEIAKKEALKISELAYLFVRDNVCVDKMIVGCESLEQLKENIRINKLPRLSSSTMEEIEKSFDNIPETIINPSKWRN